MRNILLMIVLLVLGGLGAYWYFSGHKHPVVETYAAYRKAAASEEAKNTIQLDMPQNMLADWKLKINNKKITGDTASIDATETTAWTNQDNAALAFATIITKIYRAELRKQNGAWQVVKEDLLDKKISTFEERKRAR